VDVLQLADIFENFYYLDPAWYYTSPGLAWDAMLKITEVKLELRSDVDMLRVIRNKIRGRIAVVSNRFGQANNKYMGDSFDSTKPLKYIQYFGIPS